jgi:hypothetical protein
MKRNFNLCLIAGAIAVTSLTACSDDKMEDTVLPQQESAKIQQPDAREKVCYYVDNNWSSSSVLVSDFRIPQTPTL